jgi:hypothetical protein
MRDMWWEEMNSNSPSECTVIYVYLVALMDRSWMLDPRGQSLKLVEQALSNDSAGICNDCFIWTYIIILFAIAIAIVHLYAVFILRMLTNLSFLAFAVCDQAYVVKL